MAKEKVTKQAPKNSALMDKLQKGSTIKETDILSESKFFNSQDMVQTPVPVMNVALSGRLDGGLVPGITMFAGPSKHFKTAFTLLLIKSYMHKYKDAICLFYDTEFGSPAAYFASFGIPTDRVIHTPITNIEEIKHDIMTQLKNIERGDKVIIVIDSIGNMASLKEVEDAEEGKSVADMSRAKQLKSLSRMVRPHLLMKDIPMVVVNHIYMEIGLYPKAIVSGGTGMYYNADNIFIVGRQQEKEGTDVVGYNFILQVEKSRFVREKSKIPIEVTFDGGISTWSGLLDMALLSEHVTSPTQGWYQPKGSTKKYRIKDTDTKEFWLPILTDPTFQQWIKDTYELSNASIVADFDDTDVAKEMEDA